MIDVDGYDFPFDPEEPFVPHSRLAVDLLAAAGHILIRRLRIAFPAAIPDGRTVRHYGSANDLRIMSVLCTALGVNGVASLSVPSDTPQHRAVVHADTDLDAESSHELFPPEIYLCDPRRWLRWRADLVCEPWS